MEEKFKCSLCGAEITENEINYFNDEILCDDCLDNQTVICDCCGDRIWCNDAEGDEDIALCHSCYNNNYTTCNECGRIISNDEAYYEDSASDAPLCRSCYEDIEENHVIKEYSYKPYPIFYGDNDLFIGIELEIDKGGEYDDNAQILLNMANMYEDKMYIKHDGSIDDGFEMVSHPMTLDYHINSMNWEDIFEKAVSMDYRSHQTSTCGLHCHVNRTYFGDTTEKQEEAIARVVYFVEAHWNELLKFSRRTEANINRWASRYGIADNAKNTYKNAKDKCMGRYVAVNLENYSTIEFRLFRGTLRYETFVATLQLVHEICKCANEQSDDEFEKMTWNDFVIQIEDKPELINYLKAKQLYVNEYEVSKEEI